jgi:hypothetical protein
MNGAENTGVLHQARIHVVPHTHWDREWYLPFAVYRHRLVQLMDSLLVTLEREPGLSFHLDGQMALIDDYLEVRPEREKELRRQAAAGRISLGPWYTLPDEHLVSGESLLRNLEVGLARARALGEPLLVGYLPDQFGHTAQMPQLLRLAGIEMALLWRGVPAALAGRVFSWEALDGSNVEAVHLPHGYGHGRDLPLDWGGLAGRLEREVERQREHNVEGPWLVMAGDDHLTVPVGLTAALAGQPEATGVAMSSVSDYVRARPARSATWRGELHSAAGSFVLKGTLSVRFPLKLRQAALEQRLERYLEPAWTLSERPWPERELGYAWRQLILNSAHDTVCGCSIDQVHKEQEDRLSRAEDLAESLWKGLGQAEGWFNPSPFQREGVAGLGTGLRLQQALRTVDVESLGLWLDDGGDSGDEYTYQPPTGDRPQRTRLAARVRIGDDLEVEAAARQLEGEPFVRLSLVVDNRRRDHRLRLIVPAEGASGAWAGVAFGALHRPLRAPGSEPGREHDLPTDPARGWVTAGGTAVFLAGPFEYELGPEALSVTLLRCVGWLSRADLAHRPGHAGPGLATPGAQMPGRHRFELGILGHQGGWLEAGLPRLAEVFALPLVAAPAGLAPGPRWDDPARMLSALRRMAGRVQLRTYSLSDFRIDESWLTSGVADAVDPSG